MIDAIKVLEFFEKESRKEFVDVKTGKNAIDLLKASRTCEKCNHIIRGDGESFLVGDMVCGNARSDYVTDFRMKDDTCDLWETEANVCR